MSNVAYFPGHSPDAIPEAPQKAARGPQVEEGYTRIANELYQVVNNGHSCPVNVRHLRIIHALIRRTYGFNKTMDAVADTQLAADTGIPRNKVNVAKHELIAMNVIKLSDDGRKIGINKDYASWDFTKRPEKKAPKPKSKMDQNGNSVTKMVTSEVTKTGTHKRQKDILSTDVESSAPKKQNRIDFSEFENQVDLETLKAFAEHRKAMRKPLTQRALRSVVKKAVQAAEQVGISLNDAFDEALASGWLKVEAEWLINRGYGKKSAESNAPTCPHADLLAIWDDTCGKVKGKAPNLLDWQGTKSADALAERWAEFYGVEVNGRVRYDSLETGLKWWRMALETIAAKQDFRSADADIWSLFYKGRFGRAANGNLCSQGGATR